MHRITLQLWRYPKAIETELSQLLKMDKTMVRFKYHII